MNIYKKNVTLDKILFCLFVFVLTMQALVSDAPFGDKPVLYAFMSLIIAAIVLAWFILFPRTTLLGYVLGAIAGAAVGILLWIIFHRLWLDAMIGFITFSVVNFINQRRHEKILLHDDEGRR